MVSRSQKIRLGVFLALSLTVLISAIAIITGSRLLKKRAVYYIRFKEMSLTGLEIGSPVKYRGLRIGRIDDMYIDPEDVTSIIVKISIDPKTPIKEDNEAVIDYLSIAAGLKMIEIQGGSNESKRLPPNSFIKAGQSLVDTITGKAEVITEKLELILNNLAELTGPKHQRQFIQLIESTSGTMTSIKTLLDTNRVNIHHTLENLAQITRSLDTLMVTSNLVLNDIQRITGSPQLQTTMANVEKISTELEQADLGDLIKKLAAAVEQTNRTFTHLDLTLLKSRHDILSSTEILRESLEYFNEFTRLISENPSLLLRSSQRGEIRE
ncbi:MAG: MlaD family protein [candidate division KSB1 bacterium]|nr:MlaD family protein [candidate division KSB1 bacterium]MDZ7333836.1 MlaD family protein [candidate division KSB1 bacterium]MDZ7356079.1 MlaD family protein [candidate division KSB1 bacterium]MDZ7375514.1 MlaD family protein [candidate division KSB1 bacterium]MDZ7400596.1 MlaD family protein [candidate division KSB1 bacterium]